MSEQGYFGNKPNGGGVLPEWMQDPAKFQRQLTILTLSLLLIVLLHYILVELKTVLQPLFIALFVCYLLIPVHRWVVRRGVPKKLSFIVILALFAGLLYGVGIVITADLQDLRAKWDKKDPKTNQLAEDSYLFMFEEMADGMERTFQPLLSRAGIQLREIKFDDVSSEVRSLGTAVVGGFLNVFISVFVVLVHVIFLLLERVTFPKRLERAFGEKRAGQVQEVARSVNHAVSQYLVVKTISSLATGLAAMLVLWIFDLDFVVLWGILTFLFNFIPYLGSVIASVFPILLAFVQYRNEPLWAVLMAICLLGAHQLIGNVIEPRFMGSKLHVSPLLIVMSLAFWYLTWGIVGMILAIPILVTTQIVLSNIEETRPIAILMSNE